MAREALDAVLRHARRLAEAQAVRRLTDGELLERFSRRREETAFALLLERHGAMVLGVCRRLLHHEQDAEDAFQATFLVLARKAGAIRKQASVGSWLYGVARRIALRAKAQAATRRAHERQAALLPRTPSGDDLARQELRLVLDEELARLPEKYRAPAVLCYLEGKTLAQAAQELGTGRELRRFGGDTGPLIRVAFAPDGRTVVSTSADNSVRLWEVDTGREIGRVGAKHGWPLSVAFSPDGRLLATGRDDGLVRLWDARTGALVRELRGHQFCASALAFSPDGSLLASASYSGAIRLWEVETGRECFRSPGHRGAVWSLSFSPDGRLLASASSDTTVLLTDVSGHYPKGRRAHPSPGPLPAPEPDRRAE